MVILPMNNLPKKLAQYGRDWWKHWISSYDNVALCFNKACLNVKFFCKTILAIFYLLRVHSMTTNQFLEWGTSTMLINGCNKCIKLTLPLTHLEERLNIHILYNF